MLSNELVINDLRPRLHRRARGGELRGRHPFAMHLLGLDDGDVARPRIEHVAGAEVHAADLRRLVVDPAGETGGVVAADAHLLVQLFLQPLEDRVAGIDVFGLYYFKKMERYFADIA